MEKRLKNLLDNTMGYINDKHTEYKNEPGMNAFNAYLNSCSFEIWQKVQTNTIREDWLLRLNQKMRNSEQEHRVQNGFPKLEAVEYRDSLLVHIMGFDKQYFEEKRMISSSNHDSNWALDGTRKKKRQKGDWKRLSFEHYLVEKEIEVTGTVYDMFLFLEYTECFRKRDKQTIKKFCEENSTGDMEIYVHAARERICFDPRIILQNFGEDTDYSSVVKANSIKLFDYMYNHKLVKLPDDYIRLGLAGTLDDVLVSEVGIDVAIK